MLRAFFPSNILSIFVGLYLNHHIMPKTYAIVLSLVFIASFSGLHAQTCQPDFTLPDSVVVDPLPYTAANPERGIQDTACANNYFETIVQFQIPPTFAFNGLEVPVVSVDLATTGAIANLPSTFSYTCNPPSCVFPRDSTGCIVLYGTPNASNVGVHDLKINVVIQIGIPFPLQLPNASLAPGNYFLHVKEDCLPSSTIEGDVAANTLQTAVSPNPMQDYGFLKVTTAHAGRYELHFFNAIGQRVAGRQLELVEGINEIVLETADMPNGIYQFILTNAAQTASGKLIIQH